MKKAIAPLIATVILIGFAVALAAIVIDWSRSYVVDTQNTAKEEGSKQITCNLQLGFQLVSLDGQQQICYNNDTEQIEAVVENTKEITIDQVKIRVLSNESKSFGPSLLEGFPGNISLNKGEAKKGFYNYSETGNGTIEQIVLFPVLKMGGSMKICGESAITVESPINRCEK